MFLSLTVCYRILRVFVLILALPDNIKVKDLLRKSHELPFLFLLIAMKR